MDEIGQGFVLNILFHHGEIHSYTAADGQEIDLRKPQ